MRLYFGKVERGEGSAIRITSLLDGQMQEQDGAADRDGNPRFLHARRRIRVAVRPPSWTWGPTN
jgi:hypothetical protein